MSKIITLGEIMLRLSSPDQMRFVQTKSFDVFYGGGEANVAVSLAQFGHDAYFVSRLPIHEMGQAAVNELSKYHVHTDHIQRGGDRIGIYFLETGASMRPSKVIYDRGFSSIALVDPKAFDFDQIFEGADWFHWSGITPAISENAAELTRLACQAAKKHGVTVSCDLNYRKKLWTSEQAQLVMKDLMQYVDVCIGNEEDATLVLGIKTEQSNILSGQINLDEYKHVLKEMKETYGFKMVATTLRESFSATKNGWSALLYDGRQFYESKHYMIEPIIDRVGGGDAFSGGLIHGLLTKKPQDAVEFAVAASALKHTISGDFNQVSEKEVDALVQGHQSGRVQR